MTLRNEARRNDFNLTFQAPLILNLASTPHPCLIHVHYAAMAFSFPSTNPPTCSELFLVVDPHECIRPSAHTLNRPPRYVLVRATNSLKLLRTYTHGLLTAHAYGALHGYRLFVYISSRPPTKPWHKYLFPKALSVQAVMSLLDEQGAPEEGLLWADLDGWASLDPSPEHSLDLLVDRVKQARSSVPVDVIVQGLSEVCACVFIVLRTAFGRAFPQMWHDECDTSGRLCYALPHDQVALHRVLMRAMNRSVPDTACFDHRHTCWQNLTGKRSMSYPENAERPWPHVGFVPKYPLKGPMLMGGSDYVRSSALWFHTGSSNYARVASRNISQMDLIELVSRNQGPCRVENVPEVMNTLHLTAQKKFN